MKLPNFENWSNGKLSKSTKIWLSKSIFYVKIIGIFFIFFRSKYEFRSTIFYWDCLITLILKSLYFLKWCPTRHCSNSENSIISFEYGDFLAKNFSNFVSLPWKLHNRYCHTVYPIWTSCPDLKKSLKLNVSTYFTFGSD